MSQWRDLFKMPTGMVVSGLGAMARAAGDMQDAVSVTVDSFADATAGAGQNGCGGGGGYNGGYTRALRPAERLGPYPAAQGGGPGNAGIQTWGGGGGGAPAFPPPALIPPTQFVSQPIAPRVPQESDLADDMVKLVKYDIVYTKPDEEHCIRCGETELVNYNTRADQLSAVLIAKFVRRQMLDPAFRPDNTYDVDNLRYWRVSLRVQDRFAKEETFYDRRQAKAMERIAAALGG